MIGVWKWQQLSQSQKNRVKQIFIEEYQTGKIKLVEFSRKYLVQQRMLYKWKKEHFGDGSHRAKLIYRMHRAGITNRSIADYFGVHINQVQKDIRRLTPPTEFNQPLFDTLYNLGFTATQSEMTEIIEAVKTITNNLQTIKQPTGGNGHKALKDEHKTLFFHPTTTNPKKWEFMTIKGQ